MQRIISGRCVDLRHDPSNCCTCGRACSGSLTDCVFELGRETTANEVNALFKSAAEGPLRGILGYETRPLVSVDYLNDTRSSIIDAPSTMVVNGTQLKVLAWYDNEMGYVHRMAELGLLVAKSLH